MFELKLPMTASDLNMLLNSDQGVNHESILSIGISQSTVNDVYKWLHRMNRPFSILMGEEYDAEPLNEFVETLCGLWQLRVLAYLGESYLKNLKVKLLEHSQLDSFNTLQFARAVYKAIPNHNDSMDHDFIFNHSNNLIGGMYHYSHPTHMPYPKSNRVSEEAIVTVSLSVYQILASMVYIITNRIDSLAESETEEARQLKQTFSALAVTIEAEHQEPMYPLLLLVEKINTVLKKHRSKEIKYRQKKLGLRVI